MRALRAPSAPARTCVHSSLNSLRDLDLSAIMADGDVASQPTNGEHRAHRRQLLELPARIVDEALAAMDIGGESIHEAAGGEAGGEAAGSVGETSGASTHFAWRSLARLSADYLGDSIWSHAANALCL